MAKSLHDYSTPTVANVLVGPAVNTSTENFEDVSQFCGMPSEDCPDYDGAGKPILWLAKRGRKCTPSALP
jgi:hypothetical protein